MESKVSPSEVAALVARTIAAVPQLEYLRLNVGVLGNVSVDMIRVRVGERGHGYASRALRMITDWADEHGAVLTLTPDPAPLEGERAIGRERLTRWYARHGWRRNRGRYARHEYTAGDVSTARAMTARAALVVAVPLGRWRPWPHGQGRGQ